MHPGIPSCAFRVKDPILPEWKSLRKRPQVASGVVEVLIYVSLLLLTKVLHADHSFQNSILQ